MKTFLWMSLWIFGACVSAAIIGVIIVFAVWKWGCGQADDVRAVVYLDREKAERNVWGLPDLCPDCCQRLSVWETYEYGKCSVCMGKYGRISRYV